MNLNNCTVWIILHCIQYTVLYTIYCTVYNIPYRMQYAALYTTDCTVYNILYCVQYTVLYTIYCTEYINSPKKSPQRSSHIENKYCTCLFLTKLITFIQDDAFTDVLNEMIDEVSLGLCFEVHRNVKIGFYELQVKAEKWVWKANVHARTS